MFSLWTARAMLKVASFAEARQIQSKLNLEERNLPAPANGIVAAIRREFAFSKDSLPLVARDATPKKKRMTKKPLTTDWIRIVGSRKARLDADGVASTEYIGCRATRQDTLSVAKVAASESIGGGASDQWLTMQFNQWMCVTSGSVTLTQPEEAECEPLTVEAGQTAEIPAGTKFTPSSTEDAEYMLVCMPAYKPERCLRERKTETKMLLHLADFVKEFCEPVIRLCCRPRNQAIDPRELKPEILYHLCPEREWELTLITGKAYFPPSFDRDGVTVCHGKPSRLLAFVNHHHGHAPGKWVCVEVTRQALRNAGIAVRDELTSPVGRHLTRQDTQGKWLCPNIVGGIPPGVVSKIYPVTRDTYSHKFIAIEGLTES